jgi:hypothetical protein
MYSAFDAFLSVPTWHTDHALDEERFFRALETVVHKPAFNADSLGEYIDKKREEGEAPKLRPTSRTKPTKRPAHAT